MPEHNTIVGVNLHNPKVHAVGGPYHGASTLADINNKISDANVDATGTARPPTDHATGHTNGTDDIQDATDAQKGVMTAAQAGKLDGIAANANNYSHPNHTGEVTSVADGAQTITARAVTFAKVVAVATARILGRATAGAGDVEELTAADVRTMINVADGANAYVHPNHSGEVTSVADGATTITARAVTFAKVQAIATARILGRLTAEAGDTEELTAEQVRTLINVADGANNYAHPTGDGNSHVPADSGAETGKVLMATAAAGVPEWSDVAPAATPAVPVTFEAKWEQNEDYNQHYHLRVVNNADPDAGSPIVNVESKDNQASWGYDGGTLLAFPAGGLAVANDGTAVRYLIAAETVVRGTVYHCWLRVWDVAEEEYDSWKLIGDISL